MLSLFIAPTAAAFLHKKQHCEVMRRDPHACNFDKGTHGSIVLRTYLRVQNCLIRSKKGPMISKLTWALFYGCCKMMIISYSSQVIKPLLIILCQLVSRSRLLSRFIAIILQTQISTQKAAESEKYPHMGEFAYFIR